MALVILVIAGVLISTPAASQPSDPPGPWVLDLRGATTGLPSDPAFFPATESDRLIPGRGWGLEVGGHVYVLPLGPSRLGLGASYTRVRGTAAAVAATLTAIAPQVSFNFGSSAGWSYLSAGLGRASIATTETEDGETATRRSGGLTSLNMGGGARWFLRDRLAVGFDVRVQRVAAGDATPGTMLTTVAVGLSVR